MLAQRSLFVYGFVLCVVLVATALYFQHVMGLEPCPLCIFQRIFVMVLGVVMLAGAIHDPGTGWRRGYGAATLVVAALGIVVAGRHVWLQSLPPDQVPSCGPDMSYMLEAFPLTDVLIAMTRGTGDCAEVAWSFLGLSIPGWALVGFAALTVMAALQLRAGTR